MGTVRETVPGIKKTKKRKKKKKKESEMLGRERVREKESVRERCY